MANDFWDGPISAGLCPSCGAPLEAGAVFCTMCGASVPQGSTSSFASAGTCSVCGAPLDPGAGFCTMCGAAVSSGGAAAPAPMGGSTCPVCGEPLEPGAGFCIMCGTPVSGGGISDSTTVIPPAPDPYGQNVMTPATVTPDNFGTFGGAPAGFGSAPSQPTVHTDATMAEDDDPTVRPKLLMLTYDEARNGCTKTVEVDGQSIQVDIPAGVDVNTKMDIPNYGYFDEMTGARGPLRLTFFLV